VESAHRTRPQLIIGTSARLELREDVLAKGMNAFLEKPYDHDELWMIMESAKKICKNPNNKRVLVVDDNAVNRHALMKRLEKEGFVCQGVCDGEKAVKMYLSNRFHCIFMDALMPFMDGFEATRTIREYEKKYNFKQVPIICLSGGDNDSLRQRATDMGMNDFIVKPIGSEILLNTIYKFLGNDSSQNLSKHVPETKPTQNLQNLWSLSLFEKILLDQCWNKTFVNTLWVLFLSVMLSFLWRYLGIL